MSFGGQLKDPGMDVKLLFRLLHSGDYGDIDPNSQAKPGAVVIK